MYDKENATEKKEKQQERRKTNKGSLTMHDRILNFKKDIMYGPNFVCQCCKRALFFKSIKVLKQNDINKLKEKCEEEFLWKVLNGLDLSNCTKFELCHNCFQKISSKRMPNICVANGLQLDLIPPELEVTDLEQQLFAKNLLFMKIKQMPTSRMKSITDRVINVPLNDEDISATVTKLPRLPDNAGIVAVELKRSLEMKGVHAKSYIRPKKVRNAIQKLIDIGNPFYQNIEIDEDAFAVIDENDDTDTYFSCSDSSSSDEYMTCSDSSDKEEEEDDSAPGLKDHSTCLVAINLESSVVVNEKQHPVNINNVVQVSPGQGMFCIYLVI